MREDAGGEEYIQVIIDCASLKVCPSFASE